MGNAERQDFYEMLQVTRRASADEIQQAYRKLARKFHPDVNRSPHAEAVFKEIGAAHDVLKDDAKKAVYDRIGHSEWVKRSSQILLTGNLPSHPAILQTLKTAIETIAATTAMSAQAPSPPSP